MTELDENHWFNSSMHMQLCNLEQTWLRVFRYGRLVLDVLQVALERDGFEGVAVAGVMKALSRIEEEQFDLLLSICTCCIRVMVSPLSAQCAIANSQGVTLVLNG